MHNATEIRITGLSRSGNHPIIHWMLEQIEGSYCFLNCAEGKSNPYESARPLDNGKPFQTNIPGFDLARECAGERSSKDFLLFSHEDSYLGHAFSNVFEQHHDQWVGVSGRRFDVLILRDPFNLFASRRRLQEPQVSDAIAARIWKQHAKQFRGHVSRSAAEFVPISFNHWCIDRSYRRSIAHRLGLRFTDAGREHVPQCHGGSSFDGRRYDGRAAQMQVQQRWRHYIDDPAYWKIFDAQMIEAGDAIFGGLPGFSHIVDRFSRIHQAEMSATDAA